MTTSISPPEIKQFFNKNLLLTPAFMFDIKNLEIINDFLKNKVKKFKQNPNTLNKLKEKFQNFVELCERIKIIEEENKHKFTKTKNFGYRPRLSNSNEQRIFERLNDRATISRRNRKKFKI